MLQSLFYRDRDVFLQKLHPSAALTYIGSLLALTLLFDHPLYLAGLLAATVIAVVAAGGLEVWEGYMKFGVWMVMLVMIINPLMVHSGNTVIWKGPDLHVLSSLSVSLEAICYGAAMAIRLLCVISIFCLYNLIVHPDRLLGIMARRAVRSGLVISIATRFFPVTAVLTANLREMLQLKGVDFGKGSLKERARKYAYLFNVLLANSLEDSMQIAEAMHARAFGGARRTRYATELFRPRDYICIAGCLFSVSAAFVGIYSGLSTYAFYPNLGSLLRNEGTIFILAAVLGGLLLPTALSWGWKRWAYLRLKI